MRADSGDARRDGKFAPSGDKQAQPLAILARAHGSVKLALLLLQGCDPAEAAEALDRAGGQLRIAKALVETRASRKKRA